MDLRRLSSRRSRRGISEVVGALLLMLVVVIAVGTFAYYLSNLQQQAETRNQFQVNIADEKLSITHFTEFPDDVFTQFQFSVFGSYSSSTDVGIGPSTLFYIDINPLNPAEVTVYNGTDFVTGVTLVTGVYDLMNYTTESPSTPLPSLNNQIASGVEACMESENAPENILLETTSYAICNPTLPTPSYPIVFQSASIDYMNMTIMNLNTQQSGLSRIQINDIWLNNWTQVNQTGQVIANLNAHTDPLIVPAKESVTLSFNVTDYAIPRNASVFITLLAASGNYFSGLYSLSPSLFSTNPAEQEFGQAITETISFEASSTNASVVSGYLWRIDIPTTLWTPGDGWTNPSTFITVYATGQNIPLSGGLLVGTNMTPSERSIADLSDPMRVTLFTLGANGIVTETASFLIPQNSPIGAPNGLMVLEVPTTTCVGSPYGNIEATVTDTLGAPMANVPVLFTSISGNLVLSSSTTFSTSQATLTVSTGSSGVANAYVECSGGSSSGTLEVSVVDVNPIQFGVT